MSQQETLKALHETLAHRSLPQSVAALIKDLNVAKDLPQAERKALNSMVQYSQTWDEWEQKTGVKYYRDFPNHPGLERAYKAAEVEVEKILSQKGQTLPAANFTDPKDLMRWVEEAKKELGLRGKVREAQKTKVKKTTWHYGSHEHPRGQKGGHADAREKMNAAERKEALPGVSVRAYRRAVRAVLHLEQRAGVYSDQKAREKSTLYGKTRLSYLVKWEDFQKDEASAAFVAYYAARLKMPTIFTNGSQARPMDELAQELYNRAIKSQTCNWKLMSYVITRQEVLAHLGDQEKGELLALTYEQMLSDAKLLGKLYGTGRKSMIVQPGDDSSTWNATSRAYNQARTGWLNLTKASGYEALGEVLCPGKIPALIAADVAWWHETTGGGSHEDEAIFMRLPKPWDVLDGTEVCNADMVRKACKAEGVDAAKTGWTQPYRQEHVEEVKPVAALVHGVEVASVELGELMKRLGFFSK